VLGQEDRAGIESVEEEDVRREVHVDEFAGSVSSQRSAHRKSSAAGWAPPVVAMSGVGDLVHESGGGQTIDESYEVDRNVGLLQVATCVAAGEVVAEVDGERGAPSEESEDGCHVAGGSASGVPHATAVGHDVEGGVAGGNDRLLRCGSHSALVLAGHPWTWMESVDDMWVR
jgi:hypothetical protein